MTFPLPSQLRHCYSLLFTGDSECKRDNDLRAMLCYEECRLTAENLMTESSLFAYPYFRALRKETQALINLDGKKRAYRNLKKALKKVFQKAIKLINFLF